MKKFFFLMGQINNSLTTIPSENEGKYICGQLAIGAIDLADDELFVGYGLSKNYVKICSDPIDACWWGGRKRHRQMDAMDWIDLLWVFVVCGGFLFHILDRNFSSDRLPRPFFLHLHHSIVPFSLNASVVPAVNRKKISYVVSLLLL